MIQRWAFRGSVWPGRLPTTGAAVSFNYTASKVGRAAALDRATSSWCHQNIYTDVENFTSSVPKRRGEEQEAAYLQKRLLHSAITGSLATSERNDRLVCNNFFPGVRSGTRLDMLQVGGLSGKLKIILNLLSALKNVSLLQVLHRFASMRQVRVTGERHHEPCFLRN